MTRHIDVRNSPSTRILIGEGTRGGYASRIGMDRRELLQRMDERIARTEGRVERLTRWLRWTAYRESVELARRTAIESLDAWRALRATILETWRLVRQRGSAGDGEAPRRQR